MTRRTINRGLALSGGLTALTGLFLFFHYESEFADIVHEAASLVLLVFMYLHLKVNWKALVKSLGGRGFVWTMLAVFAASIIIMLVTGTYIDLDQFPPEVLEHLPEELLEQLPLEVLKNLRK